MVGESVFKSIDPILGTFRKANLLIIMACQSLFELMCKYK